MKLDITVLLVLALTVVCVTAQEAYRRSYNGIDIDAILNNERVLKSYINCFLDKGPCTPEGREGKKLFPEIYKTNCSKCSEDQTMLLKKTIKAFVAKKKDDWAKIVDKYDPEHAKEKDFLDWVNEA